MSLLSAEAFVIVTFVPATISGLIVVIDENPITLRSTEMRLRRQGFDVRFSTTVLALQGWAEEISRRRDALIVIDYAFPAFLAERTLALARSICPGTRMILTTLVDVPLETENAVAGVVDKLYLERLPAAIVEALRGKGQRPC